MPESIAAAVDAAGSGSPETADAVVEAAQEELDAGAPAAEEEPAAEVDGEEPPAAKPPPKPQPRKLKVGEEEIDEAEAIRELGKRKEHTRAANKRFEEAATLRRQAEDAQRKLDERLAALEKDPFALHREKGMTEEQLDRLAYDRLQRRVEMKELREKDPEHFAALERREQLEKDVAALEARQATHAESEANRHADAQRAQFSAELEQNLLPALDRAQLPRHPAAAYMAEVFAMAQASKGAPLDYDEAAQSVKSFIHDSAKHYFGNLPPEALEKEFPDLAKKLRQAGVSRVAKAPTAPAPSSERPAAPRKTTQKPAEFDPHDFYANLRYPGRSAG